MLRKPSLALATVAALSLPLLPSAASAQHGGGHVGGGFGGGHFAGGHVGGWGGGWRGGGWRGGGWGWGGVGLGLGLGLGLAAPYYYGGYYGCWRPIRVATPWGPRWRRVWVCG